ncbi:tetratricopeptide repeat protein [Actinoplanes sp. NPDC026619]|uniref:ATP-binding protein n=1 Tax=Actinoplanes sp. NPDC026619 TaxID=3155798 RepID=UPI0034000006
MERFVALPDPGEAGSLDDLVTRLRSLKVWAGDPSYETIKIRVNAAWSAAGRPASELTIRSTVANCFRPGRRRLNNELVLAVVEALHPDAGYVAQWRQALRVVAGESEAFAQVRVEDKLPPDLAEFTGRLGELAELRRAAAAGRAVVISAIEGMAGVGKTQLAVHAGHQLAHEFDRVLFVNLRGFHPDPAQPPADPAAVLDGFLRRLGVPGHQIPHGLDARSTAYRARLAGVRALVVLDNAATAEQVRPLLPGTPGSLALVTSRRSLTDLGAARLTVDVFTPAEAVAFLTGAVPDVPAGPSPDAPARIAARCGYLPLALTLIAGHIRNTPGWTLTDHADRLDERHHSLRLDTGVELALTLSYRHLPAGHQRILRLLALHPGQDFEVYAAAALAGVEVETARSWLNQLRSDHLLQPAGTGRYTFHDLVRAYATTRAHDEDRPSERRAALTRLFDHYLATSATAVDIQFPANAHWRPQIPPPGTAAPDLTGPDAAVTWLDDERHTLIAVAAHTATAGWPGHTTRLARILSHYLEGGYYPDALAVHGHAYDAARAAGDLDGQAYALRDLGYVRVHIGPLETATANFRQAHDLFRQTGNRAGQARARHNLGIVADRTGRYPEAIDHTRAALALYRAAGDRTGEASVLLSLGILLRREGHYPEAIGHLEDSLALARADGNRRGEAYALNGLGEIEVQAGLYESAQDHLQQSMTLLGQLANRNAEASVLDSLGALVHRMGEPERATAYYRRALVIFRESEDHVSEAWVLNGLGEAAPAAEALVHHTAALELAAEIGVRDAQARAQAGLGRAHHELGDLARAQKHYQEALTLYIELGGPEADEVRAALRRISPEAA